MDQIDFYYYVLLFLRFGDGDMMVRQAEAKINDFDALLRCCLFETSAVNIT